ncbi:pilus assembly protein PilM [Chloroflexota bacterium]
MVTLEISSTGIRLMEIEEGRVTKWASRSLEPGVLEEEVISDSKALSTAVKQLMDSSGIKARNITASVSGLYSLSRIVMMATPVGGSVTQQAVLEAAAEVMPLSEEELYLSWQTVGTAEGGQNALVVGVPRDVVDSEMQALRLAGLKPRILDLKTMALARAVNREQALILNIESTTFDIVVVNNGVTEVMRTTAWQPDDLSLEDRAEHLVVILELTVGFHNSHNPDSPLDPTIPLFITGQMSGDLDLMETLQARVGYPIESLEPPLEYPAHLPVSQYAVNIGLALKGTAAVKNLEQSGFSLPDINLLPQAYQPWKPSAKQIYFFLAIVAAIALIFPLYQVTSAAIAETAMLKTRSDIINTELEKRQGELAEREPLQKAINEYRTIVNMGGNFTEDLQVIKSQAAELGIKLQPITHTGGSITFNCAADNYTAFRDYLSALEESGRFSITTRPVEQYSYVKSGHIALKPKTGE